MPRASVLLACLATLVTSPLAFADGAFFSVRRDMAEPNQKAVLFLEGGRETLLLEVRYDGETTDFGWVVPVPARPKLRAGNTRLFAELSALTRPWGMKGKKGRGAGGGGGGEGVVVLERLQVGPYDSTVLAASDSGALARWLQTHHYLLPPRAESVLQSYVDRGWYYVAMRIDTTRQQAELLARMQRLDPSIRSFDDAPAKIAAKVMRIAEADTPKHKPALSAPLAQVRALLEDLPPAYDFGGLEASSMLGATYHEYVDSKPQRARAGLVTEAEAQEWLKCPVSDRDLLAAARAVALKGRGRKEIARALATRTSEDLRTGVPYDRSVLGRLHAVLARRDARACDSLSNEATAYEWRRTFRRKLHVMPPPSQAETEKQREQAMRVGGPLEHTKGSQHTWSAVTELVFSYGAEPLYRFVYDSLQRAPQATAIALHTGAIQPLRLDFDSPKLVYPLLLSSLSTGESLVQLYVLSNHRAEASDLAPGADAGRHFEATWAGRLSAEQLRGYPELRRLVTPGRSYLTELQARLAPEEMQSDLVLLPAPSDEAVGGRRGAGR